jgi:hypothetical protein
MESKDHIASRLRLALTRCRLEKITRELPLETRPISYQTQVPVHQNRAMEESSAKRIVLRTTEHIKTQALYG